MREQTPWRQADALNGAFGEGCCIL